MFSKVILMKIGFVCAIEKKKNCLFKKTYQRSLADVKWQDRTELINLFCLRIQNSSQKKSHRYL